MSEPKKTIDICLVTWPNHIARLAYFVTTFYSLKARLSASRHELRWWCSADGAEPHCGGTIMHDIRKPFIRFCDDNDIEHRFRNAVPNLGANMNAAMRMGAGDYIFLAQDDWLLLDDVDLSDGCDLLVPPSPGKGVIDLIRYSWPDQDGMRPRMVGGGAFQCVDNQGPWPYGDDPHLRTRASLDTLGYYLEGGGHGSASGDFMRRLIRDNRTIFATEQTHFRHIGDVTAVIDDKRKRRVSR